MLTIKMLEFVRSKCGIIAAEFEFRIFRFVYTIFLVFFLKIFFYTFALFDSITKTQNTHAQWRQNVIDRIFRLTKTAPKRDVALAGRTKRNRNWISIGTVKNSEYLFVAN